MRRRKKVPKVSRKVIKKVITKITNNAVNLGDLVFTYDWRLAQVRGLQYGSSRTIDIKVTGVRLNTGEIVYPYELVRVRYISAEAKKILRERGRSTM